MGRPCFLAVMACASLLAAGVLMRRHCGMGFRQRAVGGVPVPTPKPRSDDPNWMACHAKHVEALRTADEAEEGFHLLFFGDSITEDWEATDHCLSCLGQERCDGVPAVFQRHYSKWRAGVLAIGGDQTAHLLWRLRNGEVPAKHQPKVAVLLIGTNDLGAAAWGLPDQRTAEEELMKAVPGTTLRVLQTLHTLKDLLPTTHVVLLALLPRGSTWNDYTWPSLYTQPMQMVNAHFRDYAALDGHLHFLDCGDRFLAPDRRAISAALMPDGLHPNAAGHELLAQCLDPLVTKLMQRGAEEGGQDAEGAPAGGRGDVATLAVGTL